MKNPFTDVLNKAFGKDFSEFKHSQTYVFHLIEALEDGITYFVMFKHKYGISNIEAYTMRMSDREITKVDLSQDVVDSICYDLVKLFI